MDKPKRKNNSFFEEKIRRVSPIKENISAAINWIFDFLGMWVKLQTTYTNKRGIKSGFVEITNQFRLKYSAKISNKEIAIKKIKIILFNID